jgi:hypothetical protein
MGNKICHSGGATGADFIWENEALKKGYKIKSYSFEGHNTKSKNRVILTEKELKEGFEQIKSANKLLNRNLNNLISYTKKLISRDWFQAKNADAIYAVGVFDGDMVAGGTAYCVACAINLNKPVYFFEQNEGMWYIWNNGFEVCEEVTLVDNFAGVGTRKINQKGIDAITKLF